MTHFVHACLLLQQLSCSLVEGRRRRRLNVCEKRGHNPRMDHPSSPDSSFLPLLPRAVDLANSRACQVPPGDRETKAASICPSSVVDSSTHPSLKSERQESRATEDELVVVIPTSLFRIRSRLQGFTRASR